MTDDDLIEPERLPQWVPGQLTVQSPGDWDGVSARGYRYAGSDVLVPPLRDYMVVAYRHGRTAMSRRVDGDWAHHDLGPGDVSLLTRAAESHWVWPEDVEVVHVYLTQAELAATCREMYERDVYDVELHDVVKADDPAIHHTAMLIANEAALGAAGSRLMVESLTSQLSVQILRRHAHVLFREGHDADMLTLRQDRAVQEYIAGHLGEAISLDDLAASAGLSRFHFSGRFRRTKGTSPHDFVLQQRVEQAGRLLSSTNRPILDIALSCGFADQSHLNREFGKRLGTTPGRYRAQSG